jgi:cytidylate kinase
MLIVGSLQSIAIDGPVASGKSAVGSQVARALGYRFIDTGVMYRAVTWLALKQNVDLRDEDALATLAANAKLVISPTASDELPSSRVLIDGEDVTELLRSPEVGEAVSLVSRVPGVREAMVRLQRELASEAPTVMAGRDIGTVVLPDAGLKIYLDASVDERVRRRHGELLATGNSTTLEEERRELRLRDEIDSSRTVSPLKPAEDAIIVHTDHLSLDDVVKQVLELASC